MASPQEEQTSAVKIWYHYPAEAFAYNKDDTGICISLFIDFYLRLSSSSDIASFSIPIPCSNCAEHSRTISIADEVFEILYGHLSRYDLPDSKILCLNDAIFEHFVAHAESNSLSCDDDLLATERTAPRFEVFIFRGPPPARLVHLAVEAANCALQPATEIHDDDEEIKTCPICLQEEETTGTPEELFLKTPCNHVFHPLCLLVWLLRNPTCPCCRYRFPVETH